MENSAKNVQKTKQAGKEIGEKKGTFVFSLGQVQLASLTKFFFMHPLAWEHGRRPQKRRT